MNVRKVSALGVVGFSMAMMGLESLRAELPSMEDRKWVGNFIGVDAKNYQFGITTLGRGRLDALGSKGTPITSRLGILVDFLVQETMPDGRVVVRAIQPESLESAQPATQKPVNVTFKGKVTGDAAFEVYVNEERGVLSLGGKITDLGTLTKNPVRFVIRTGFPDAYTTESEKGDDKKDKGDAKKAEKAFEQKTSKDRLQLKFIDGQTRKQSLADAVDAASPEVNGPGIAALSLEVSSYKGSKFLFSATPNSSMTLSNAGTKPLHGGFAAIWTADPAKDPEAKARLILDVK